MCSPDIATWSMFLSSSLKKRVGSVTNCIFLCVSFLLSLNCLERNKSVDIPSKVQLFALAILTIIIRIM